MFRIINRFIISKHLSRLSNVSLKSHKYYSSEPPDKVLSVRLKSRSDRKPEELETGSSDTFFRTTASELNIFGPHDMRAPLNGNIGLGYEERRLLEAKTLVNLIRKSVTIERINNLSQKSLNSNSIDIESLVSDSDEKRCKKLFRILKYQKLFPQEMGSAIESTDLMAFNAYDLPFKVIKKFEALFTTSNRSIFSDGLTALTLTKKTANDMSGYSEEVELERETFFEQFITDAKNICVELQKSGFWADFIDPYSGQPFLSEQTNETLFETDDRFLHLGFKIEDLGCCKAIHHNKWGTHVIVGTLFTTAPVNSSALRKLMTETVTKETKTDL